MTRMLTVLAPQTPSPKPTKIPERQNSLKIISIYGSNVRRCLLFDRHLQPGKCCTSRLEARRARSPNNAPENRTNANILPVERNGRKTLTTVQGLPKKFDQKKILKVIKKQFACNGTIVADSEMGEVIQLQGDQRKVVQEFLINKKEGLGLDSKGIKVHGF
ncbi:protein translation factor sui1 [Colletotrichum spaethianum]|uniref:Protein translation factor sui1 n=1 Tax=Colletotrichum spaethianum TaxID=700344 RepID=A0AA37LG74_9PEZI|nr:protein translation factor sui1 [Colletotrichum spaethianum]GKT45975.1 protein translation factor sui1 [Colletotrichum spaethianum]